MTATCTRCGGSDAVAPLPKRFACKRCGNRGLCYACDVTHNVWCAPPATFALDPDFPPACGYCRGMPGHQPGCPMEVS